MIKKMAAGFLVSLFLAIGLAANAADFFFHDGDRVVFLGDSITEQKLYTTYIEAYTLTRFPQWKLTFRNVGWGGDTAWLRQRAHPDENRLFAARPDQQRAMVEKSVGAGLARDVLPLKPTAVTVDFGMNDHSYQPFREDIFRAYCRSQAEIVKVLAKHGARVALVTPQPIEDRRPDPNKDVRNQSLRAFSDGLEAICYGGKALYVDEFDPYMAIMMKERASNPQAQIGAGDAVHPGPTGHTLMAWAILKGLHAPALASVAEIDVASTGAATVRAEAGASVNQVKFEQGKLSFDRTDTGLPMPIDPRAEASLKLAPVLDDLSRYELKVSGLPAGHYQLTIDGELAATVTAEELGKGFNLSVCPGPIAKQVQKVLSLVFEKNNVYFDRWRNVQLGRGTDSRLKELDGRIAALEVEIDAARVPKPHHFVLEGQK